MGLTRLLCLAMDPTIRVVGAVSLWTIEIIMQLRVYALFDRSRKLALINAFFFFLSILGFMVILVVNAIRRPALIAKAIGLPLPGCPVVNGLVQWAQWIPATIFEIILFSQILYKACTSLSSRIKLKQRVSLEEVLLGDHVLYFLGITLLLIFNNMMVITGVTRIPWFGLADNLEGGVKSNGELRTGLWRDLSMSGPDDYGVIERGSDDMREVGTLVGMIGKGKGKAKMMDFVGSDFENTSSFKFEGHFSARTGQDVMLLKGHSRSGSASDSSSNSTLAGYGVDGGIWGGVVIDQDATSEELWERRGSDSTLVDIVTDRRKSADGVAVGAIEP
ncbi:hypothetical protein CVT24_009289 [Panaeolus cyanescens]|uniref:Uncharacterized protein n=1 Tax=Panaeolus cyanescens TaxID=181874 RepID=A0A409Y8J3_9AGAR|nr:hypothetical protein CVT24_009289 [Panaeolus cyanescens]